MALRPYSAARTSRLALPANASATRTTIGTGSTAASCSTTGPGPPIPLIPYSRSSWLRADGSSGRGGVGTEPVADSPTAYLGEHCCRLI
jgi:hypothetical protein